MPLVSVLLPARNAERTLPSALASVRRQTLRAFECVVVDDGSRDETPAIVRQQQQADPRFRLISQPHAGIVAALNLGIRACRAPFVARMDADDWMHPRRLQLQTEHLYANPAWAGAGCHVRLFPRSRLQAGRLAYERWLNSLSTPTHVARDAFVECPLAHPTLMLRRTLLSSYQYRDRGWAEDYDLILRLLADGHLLGTVPERLLWWRDHSARLSRTSTLYAQRSFVECKAHFLCQTLLASHPKYLLWGYGRTGKQLSKALARHGRRPCAILELHPGRIGQVIAGAPVLAPEALPRYFSPAEPRRPLLISVAHAAPRSEARNIARRLNLRDGTDFVCVA